MRRRGGAESGRSAGRRKQSVGVVTSAVAEMQNLQSDV